MLGEVEELIEDEGLVEDDSELDGLRLALGEILLEGLRLDEVLDEGEVDAETLELGEVLADKELDGLTEAEGDLELDGLRDADADELGDLLDEGDREALKLELGLIEVEGDIDDEGDLDADIDDDGDREEDAEDEGESDADALGDLLALGEVEEPVSLNVATEQFHAKKLAFPNVALYVPVADTDLSSIPV